MILVVSALVASPGTARAEPPPASLDGEVMRVDSRWTPSRDRIVSETTVRLDDGTERALLQLGGSVDGLGMVVSHMPSVPRPGQRVHATYSQLRAPSGATVNRVETISTVVTQSIPGDRPDPGYVNTRTRGSGVPLYWSSSCSFIAYDADGTSHLDNEFEIMDDVLATWRSVFENCSYFRFEIEGKRSGETSGYDGINLIEFLDTRWCRAADGDTPEMCYAPAAAALTTLFFVDDPGNDRDGEIVDSDIELNGVNFAISDQGNSNGGANCLADLGNTLTHEVGHLIGLDHTCWTGQVPRPVDHDGDEVPSCAPEFSLPDDIKDATMYNFQVCGETKKSTPEQDDIDAVCALYPSADDPGVCKRVNTDGGGCCTVAPSRRRAPGTNGFGGLLIVALSLGLTIVVRTRARRAVRSTSPRRSRRL